MNRTLLDTRAPCVTSTRRAMDHGGRFFRGKIAPDAHRFDAGRGGLGHNFSAEKRGGRQRRESGRATHSIGAFFRGKIGSASSGGCAGFPASRAAERRCSCTNRVGNVIFPRKTSSAPRRRDTRNRCRVPSRIRSAGEWVGRRSRAAGNAVTCRSRRGSAGRRSRMPTDVRVASSAMSAGAPFLRPGSGARPGGNLAVSAHARPERYGMPSAVGTTVTASRRRPAVGEGPELRRGIGSPS